MHVLICIWRSESILSAVKIASLIIILCVFVIFSCFLISSLPFRHEAWIHHQILYESSRTICEIRLDNKWIIIYIHQLTINLRKVVGAAQHGCTSTWGLTSCTHVYNEMQMHCYILLYLTKQHVGSDGKHNQRVRKCVHQRLSSWVN